MDEICIQAFFKFKKTEPAEISKRTRVCIHCSFRKQKCRLKSTTTNGCRHFGQSEQRKSSILFPIQSEKSPDSGFFTCDPTKKCIMPSSRERHKGIIGRGHDLRLSVALLPCYSVTLLPCYSVTLLPCYSVTLFPCYFVNLLVCYLVTLFSCYFVLPRQSVTLLLCYLVTLLPITSRYLGMCVDVIRHMHTCQS